MHMNKEKELVKNTAIISFGKICTQLVSFFLLPVYTKVLSISEYGMVDLVLTYSSLVLPFVTLALEQALFRMLIDVRNDIDKCKKYISTTIYCSCGILVIVLIIIFILGTIFDDFLFLYFGMVLIGSVISSITLQICRGLGDNIGYTLGSTVAAILQIICNVIFLVCLGFGAEGMMIASFIGNSLSGVVIFFRCRLKKYIKFSKFSRSMLKDLLSYSLPLIPNQLSWWALNASDKVIVQFFIGVAGNGLIAVANKFSGVYIQFSAIFNISWTESVARHIKDDDSETFLSNTINSVYRLFLCACCGIIVCMPFVFPILVNQQFTEAYGLIPIFMLASLFNVVVSLYGVIYVAYKKTIEIAKTAIYAAMLNIFTHLILIKFISIYAAAISTAVGYGGMALYRYFHSRKYITIKFSHETLIYSIFLIVISCTSYYCTQIFIQLIAFIIVCIMSFVINRKLIESVFDILRNKYKDEFFGK